MQATAQAKGAKPNRSGLLTGVLLFAAGLSLGALAWAGIDAYRTDDADSVAADVVVVAPSVNRPTDNRTGLGSDGQVTEGGIMSYPDVYSQPGEPNLDVDETLQSSAIETDRADWLAQQEPFGASSETRTSAQTELNLGSIGAWAVDAAREPQAHHQPGMGQGIIGGFGEYPTELPMARHEPGMGEGYVGGFGESVDPDIAQDPVAQPGVGYFA